MSDDEILQEDEENKETKEFRVIKSYTDIQRLKLEKLMSDPQKPVHIPARPVDHEVNRAAEFNHNIMGSSAGAGSGEFHLYRQMRRKEQNRVKQLAYRKKRDDLNLEFKQKIEENEKLASERTEKKRLKRLKKKKGRKSKKEVVVDKASSESESEELTSDKEETTEVPASDQPSVDPLMAEPPKKDPLIVYY